MTFDDNSESFIHSVKFSSSLEGGSSVQTSVAYPDSFPDLIFLNIIS